MTRTTFRHGWTALVLIAAGGSSPALAQTIGGQNPAGPAVSPYLNLARPGTLPGINYYGLVQPQMQFQSSISNLQQNQMGLVQSVTTGGSVGSGPVTTGHPVMFGNYSHYYRPPATAGGAGLGTLAAQQNFTNRGMMLSPARFLGGMTSTGLGGISTSGLAPGISPVANPSGSSSQLYPR